MKPLLLLGLALTVVSCGSNLWNRPLEAVRGDLEAGRTDFLLNLTPKDLTDASVGLLGEGAAWNLGAVYAAADRWPEAELLWKRSLAGEGGPWREQSGRDLFTLYSDRRDWPKAEAVAQKLVSFDAARPEFRRKLFEAYYFQKKDEPAWELLKSWTPGLYSPAEETENQLFRAVLSARAGKLEDAAAPLKDLMFSRTASSLHFRLEGFFQEDEGRYELLGPGGREAVAFQSLSYRAVPKDLQAWLKGRTFPEGFWNRRAFIENLEALYKAEPRAETGLRILDQVSPGLTGEARYALEFARGRLYRALGWWPQARTAFQKALSLAPRWDDRKKTTWNLLNAWVQTSPEAALPAFLQAYANSFEPSFYSDVFSDWITGLVQDRRWDLLAAIVRDLGPRLPPDDRVTAGFVVSRLASYGLINLDREGVYTSAPELLGQVVAAQPYSYEGLMSRAVLGKPLEWPAGDVPEPEYRTDDRGRDQNRLWESMAHLGLARRMALEMIASDAPLDPALVVRVSRFLQSRGQYRPTLQILYRLLRDPGRLLTEERALLLFPRAFETLVQDRAEAEGLEPSLLLGLMREESSFDPTAKSWVGAQGLTQLMPATAAETAQRLKMKTYDLADPEDNVTLGARYLSTMVKSQGRIYLALMAYNAGGGRIRPWKQAMGRLPEEIFVEAAPIEETRGYVKKILTSTVMIGVLHYHKTLDEMVRLIYPGFEP